MKLPDFVQNAVRNIIVSQIAKDVYGGKYGKGVQAFAVAMKGKKRITGWGLIAISGALVFFSNPLAPTLAPIFVTVGAVLAGLGWIEAGIEKKPAGAVPEELREAYAQVLSAITVLGIVANASVSILQSVGSPKALAVSGYIQLGALAVTSATGYLAGLVDEQYVPVVSK